MSIPDPLAFEIRRLATVLGRDAGLETDTSPLPPPGELAERIVTAFNVRPIDAEITSAASTPRRQEPTRATSCWASSTKRAL